MTTKNIVYKDLLNEIMSDWNDGKYTYKYKSLPTYSENYVFDENLSVRRNREMVIEANEAAKQAQKDGMIKQHKLDEKFKQDCVDYLMGLYGFSDELAEYLYNEVFADKHHSMYEFFHTLDQTADFVEECFKKSGFNISL